MSPIQVSYIKKLKQIDMAFNYKKHCKDFTLLFITRILRMIAYGMLALIFFDNLFIKGITEMQASLIQTCIVAGDIVISLYLTTRADKIGRINTLMLGALLKLITGFIYAQAQSLTILIVAGIFGVISVTGGQIGPFMPIEQSALSQLVEKCSDSQDEVPKNISKVFGYYNMAGYLSQAGGAAFAGIFMKVYTDNCGSEADALTNIVRMYALLGGLCFILYFMMNPQNIEPDQVQIKQALNFAGIESRNMKNLIWLSLLFAFDALGGAFIVQSYLSFYYQQKYERNFQEIGFYLFICNIISGISGILSSKIVDCIGALATMIYTHLPSNIFLLLIAFTDNPTYSILFLMARFCISQMDVPARQTFVTLLVSPAQRSAANGITNVARSVGLSIGLGFNGIFMRMNPDIIGFSVPFLIAGGVKIFYDLVLGMLFLWNKKKEPKYEAASLQMSQRDVADPSINQ